MRLRLCLWILSVKRSILNTNCGANLDWICSFCLSVDCQLVEQCLNRDGVSTNNEGMIKDVGCLQSFFVGSTSKLVPICVAIWPRNNLAKLLVCVWFDRIRNHSDNRLILNIICNEAEYIGQCWILYSYFNPYYFNSICYVFIIKMSLSTNYMWITKITIVRSKSP